MDFISSARVAPSGRFSKSRTLAALLPSRAAPSFLAALGAFFAGLAFLAVFAFLAATWARVGATRAFLPGFGFSVQVKGHGSKFDRKREEAIAALLTQRNVEDAARAVGIGISALLRWMKEPEFEGLIGKPGAQHLGSQWRDFSRPQVQPFRRC